MLSLPSPIDFLLSLIALSSRVLRPHACMYVYWGGVCGVFFKVSSSIVLLGIRQILQRTLTISHKLFKGDRSSFLCHVNSVEEVSGPGLVKEFKMASVVFAIFQPAEESKGQKKTRISYQGYTVEQSRKSRI